MGHGISYSVSELYKVVMITAMEEKNSKAERYVDLLSHNYLLCQEEHAENHKGTREGKVNARRMEDWQRSGLTAGYSIEETNLPLIEMLQK
jgi:hypothetical protein